jgi:hypothetical protein
MKINMLIGNFTSGKAKGLSFRCALDPSGTGAAPSRSETRGGVEESTAIALRDHDQPPLIINSL